MLLPPETAHRICIVSKMYEGSYWRRRYIREYGMITEKKFARTPFTPYVRYLQLTSSKYSPHKHEYLLRRMTDAIVSGRFNLNPYMFCGTSYKYRLMHFLIGRYYPLSTIVEHVEAYSNNSYWLVFMVIPILRGILLAGTLEFIVKLLAKSSMSAFAMTAACINRMDLVDRLIPTLQQRDLNNFLAAATGYGADTTELISRGGKIDSYCIKQAINCRCLVPESFVMRVIDRADKISAVLLVDAIGDPELFVKMLPKTTFKGEGYIFEETLGASSKTIIARDEVKEYIIKYLRSRPNPEFYINELLKHKLITEQEAKPLAIPTHQPRLRSMIEDPEGPALQPRSTWRDCGY